MSFIDELLIEIPGKPVPKGRPRFNMKSGRIYTPKKTLDEELRIRAWIASKYYKHFEKYNNFTGLVILDLSYHLPFPSHFRKANKIENAPHIIKPDLDNLMKLTIDAINKVLFEDDCQIGQINACKSASINPRTSIRISYFE